MEVSQKIIFVPTADADSCKKNNELISIMVEGKVEEPFGDTILG